MGERQEKGKEPVNEVDSHVANKYEIRRRIGKGAYGIVWKAIDRKTGMVVAVKKIFDAFRNDTDAQRTFREIVFLLEFSAHPNVIRLLNVLKAENHKDIYLVFQFMETDLHNVIRKGGVLSDIHHRYIMYQMLRAIKYLHSGSVIHRDLKPSNVLINSDCKIKVADFGLARSIDSLPGSDSNNDPTLTNYVATRWYRAPEILLNSKSYTVGVDMWSLGCILAEMLLGRPLFPGSSTLDQIDRIMNVIKPPKNEDLKHIPSHLAVNLTVNSSNRKSGGSLRELLSGVPMDALNLVEKLLVFNPNKRPTADEALAHPYVARFRNVLNEPYLTKAIVPSIRDDIQLSVDMYRNKLYELISMKKTKDRKRESSDCHHNNLCDNPQNSNSQLTGKPTSNNSKETTNDYQSKDCTSRAKNNSCINNNNHKSKTITDTSKALQTTPAKVTIVAKDILCSKLHSKSKQFSPQNSKKSTHTTRSQSHISNGINGNSKSKFNHSEQFLFPKNTTSRILSDLNNSKINK